MRHMDAYALAAYVAVCLVICGIGWLILGVEFAAAIGFVFGYWLVRILWRAYGR